ncbi:TetR/AcrR family transcriptional regulator [Gordonia oryzae]|uniref:TetR/AcrR family transcriptional regulator n=1 Tax=Gordonia oryzae TaxID=2487349 RepID=UPI001FE92BBF|nr:TetR/AcrR family transcriptional regulator [Gordonia oryzae]
MNTSVNSRVVSQSQNRARLKACARQLLLADGYAATSIAKITGAAGLTTGAYYSNFDNKAQLTIELLQDLQAENQQHVEAILATADVGARINALQAWVETILASGWPRLELEFALASRGDAGLVEQEGHRNHAATRALEKSLEQLAPSLTQGPVPVRRIAEIILDLGYGLAVRTVIDPTVTSDHLFEIINIVAGLVGTPTAM